MLLALLAVLVVLTLVWGRREEEGPVLSARSTAPSGGRALALWLGELGYRVEELDRSPCRMAPGIDLLLMLRPTSEVDRRSVDCLATWVEAGGHLVLAVEIPLQPGESVPQRLLERFWFRLRSRDTRQAEAGLIQPVLLRPPVERVTIKSENPWALGYVRYQQDKSYVTTQAQLTDILCVLLAAREAEQLLIGDVATGAVDDLRRATALAHDLIELCGMGGPEAGVRQYRDPSQPTRRPDLSEVQKAVLDARVSALIEEQRHRAERLLAENKAALATLRDLLVERKTLDAKELRAAAGPTVPEGRP